MTRGVSLLPAVGAASQAPPVRNSKEESAVHRPPGFIKFARTNWGLALPALLIVGLFAFPIFQTGGRYVPEIVAVLMTGLVGGGLVRALVRESRVTVVFAVLVVAEVFLAVRFPSPWSALATVLVPANAAGVMVGNFVRLAILERRRKAVRDVWVINGEEEPRTDTARTAALAGLASWDSAKDGAFVVERNDGWFEAMGSPLTGFIVHCSANFREESEWRALGSIGAEETVIRIPSGPAYAPSGVVVDLETARAALRGFFHYRGPDPELTWASGEQVLELKFG
jgi:hypothetical protein